MVNAEQVAKKLAKLAMLKFFPADKEARAGIFEMVCDMASDEFQVDWLVKRILSLYNEWPGPHELRACFCSRFPPRDGINAYSQVYLDGIPSEHESRAQLGSAAPRALLKAADEEITDPGAKRAIQRLAERMPTMPSGKPIGGRFEKRLREVETSPKDRPELPGPTPQIITQADIDREVAKLREKPADEDYAKRAAGDVE